MKKILLVIALLLVAGAAQAATKAPASRAISFSPQFAVGVGAYLPTDIGAIRDWKGVESKNYAWAKVALAPWKGLDATLKTEQVIQRLPNGTRPTMLTRFEVGWKF